MHQIDSTTRFTDRVDAYLAGRPTYPRAIVTHLQTVGALSPGACVVDLGAGTGLSSAPFLEAGYSVIGVEPNDAMRDAGARFLARYGTYRSVRGTAEASTQAAACADLVVAGQAFHWFDPAAARREALRILKPGGWAALMWNDRDRHGPPFEAGYERLMLEFGDDYEKIRYRHDGIDSIPAFFGGAAPPVAEFHHTRPMDWSALESLAHSASYLPKSGHPRHDTMLAALRTLFDAHAESGAITMHYTTRVYAAPMSR